MTKADTRKVYGYARVSSRGQAENGLSLDAQEAAIRYLAALKAAALKAADPSAEDSSAWADVEVLVERGKSGKDMKRPMLERLRREVQAGRVSHVICMRVDRISRSTFDLLKLLREFKEHEVGFVSVSENIDTTTSLGEFVLTLVGAIATLESAKIGERTADVLRDARRKGKAYSGTPPYGWIRKGDSLVADTSEQNFLAAARKMRVRGQSWQAIANWLTSVGAKPRGGKKWYPATARQVLNSKMALESVA